MFRRKYRYTALPGEEYIRLFELLPTNKSESTIKIAFHVVKLDSSPAFDTISYIQNDMFRSAVVYCNGGAIEISTNLHDILLQLRKESLPRLLWHYGLCVYNNSTKGEETYPRDMGSSIYMKAKSRICWPGAPHPSSIPKLIRRIHELRGSSEAEKDGLITDPDPYRSNFKVTTTELQPFQTLPLFENEVELQNLSDYLDLPYFQGYVVTSHLPLEFALLKVGHI